MHHGLVNEEQNINVHLSAATAVPLSGRSI